MTLKERLLAADLGLTEADFDHHEYDLYVKASPAVRQWLENNYAWYENVTTFPCRLSNEMWFDIPFAAR